MPGPAALGVLAAVTLAPLVWVHGLVAEYSLPKLSVLSGAVLLAGFGCRGNGERRALDEPVAWVAGAFALSLAFSSDRLLSLLGFYNQWEKGLLACGLYGALYWTASRALSESEVLKTLRLAVVAGAAVGAYAVLQGLGHEPFGISGEGLPGGRAVSTIGSPVHLGVYLAMLLPLALSWWWSAEKDSLEAWAAFCCAVFLLAGLAASRSRSAWIAAAVGCAVWARWGAGWRASWRTWALAAVVAAAGAWGFQRRQAVAQSDLGRFEGWRVAWSAFLERPFLGHGPGTFGSVFRQRKTEAFVKAHGFGLYHEDAHNDWLQALATTGLVGLLAYLMLWGGLGVALLQSKDTGQTWALAGSLAALFVALKVNPGSLETLSLGAVLAGLLCRRPSEEPASGPSWSALAFGAAALGLSFRMISADRLAFLARNSPPQRAAGLWVRATAYDPCEPSYRVEQVNALIGLVRADPGSAARRDLVERARGAAAAIVACHPGNVVGHYAAGYVELVAAQLGDVPRAGEAVAAFDRALSLDPSYSPIRELRAEAVAVQERNAKG